MIDFTSWHLFEAKRFYCFEKRNRKKVSFGNFHDDTTNMLYLIIFAFSSILKKQPGGQKLEVS